MAKALGVGGIFFKSPDPKALADWYQRWLNIPVMNEPAGAFFTPTTMPAKGGTVWSPFSAETEYFAPSSLPFMFNLVVDDLDGALEQVVEGGASLVGDVQSYEYGRFGWFIDLDGNKVELWEPTP